MHRSSLPRLDPFIRLIEGDDGAEGGAPPETKGEGGDEGAGQDGEGDGKAGDGGSGDGEKDKPEGKGDDGGSGGGKPEGGKTYDERYVEKLRNEAIKARKAGDAEREKLVKGLRTLLGEGADEEETDPAKLAASAVKDRDDARGQALSLTRENAVLRAAGGLGVDADRLLDSRGFERQLADLDPAADSFAADVKALIKKAAEKDPALKVKTVPPPQNGERMAGEAGADGKGGAATAKSAVEKVLAERTKRRGSD